MFTPNAIRRMAATKSIIVMIMLTNVFLLMLRSLHE